jgi:hypothetical protein
MNRRQAAQRGWSNSGVTDAAARLPNEPSRRNALWNDREDYDLLEAFTAGVTIPALMTRHGRTRYAVARRIDRALDGATRYMETMR